MSAWAILVVPCVLIMKNVLLVKMTCDCLCCVLVFNFCGCSGNVFITRELL